MCSGGRWVGWMTFSGSTRCCTAPRSAQAARLRRHAGRSRLERGCARRPARARMLASPWHEPRRIPFRSVTAARVSAASLVLALDDQHSAHTMVPAKVTSVALVLSQGGAARARARRYGQRRCGLGCAGNRARCEGASPPCREAARRLDVRDGGYGDEAGERLERDGRERDEEHARVAAPRAWGW
jgi:hypothetical protein